MARILALLFVLGATVCSAQEPDFNIIRLTTAEYQQKYNKHSSPEAAIRHAQSKNVDVIFTRRHEDVDAIAAKAFGAGQVFYVVNDDDGRFPLGWSYQSPQLNTNIPIWQPQLFVQPPMFRGFSSGGGANCVGGT